MKEKKQMNYVAPTLCEETLGVECGFAGSGDEWYRNETNNANIGWSYSDSDESWD